MICTEEEVALMPIKDGSALRARLVDGGCHSFINKKSGAVLQATKDQMISSPVWRILWERISINSYRRSQKSLWKYMQKIPFQFWQVTGKYI